MNKSKSISTDKFQNSIILKIIFTLYITALAVFISYQTSKVFYELLWPNERFAVVAFMSIAIVIPFYYMVLSGKNIFKSIVLYHFILIFTALFMVIDYRFRPIYLVVMLTVMFMDFSTGVVVNACICGFGFFSMASEPEFFFTVVTLITGTMCAFTAKKHKSSRSNIIFALTSFVLNVVMHISFIRYCDEAYEEYSGITFVIKASVSVVLSLLIYFIIYILYNKFILGKGTKKEFRNIVREDNPSILLMKEKAMPVYYHSKEVAKLSRNAAKAIDADEELAYAGGMYHEIGKLFGKEYIKEGVKYIKKNKLPSEIKDIIITHNAKIKKPKTKEAAIVMLADTVASAYMYIKTKEGAQIDNKKLVDNAFVSRFNSGALNECGITAEELYNIKKSFLISEENLDAD